VRGRAFRAGAAGRCTARACQPARSRQRCRSTQSRAHHMRRNRTTTLAHHYIAAFVDEKRRLARRGHVSYPAARTRMEKTKDEHENTSMEKSSMIQERSPLHAVPDVPLLSDPPAT